MPAHTLETTEVPRASAVPTVAAADLAHGFQPGVDLFTSVSFTVTAGEVVALVGPSGSGKSTLLSIIAGWQTPRAGTITREHVDRIGWVFQNPHGVARRSALDHVVLPFLARGERRADAEEQAHAILETFALDAVAHRDFRHLSGGEAQRLMLARATAVSPDVLLVDEPTAQLDRHTAETVNSVLAGIAQADAAVIVATHDQQTRQACDRAIDLAEYQSP